MVNWTVEWTWIWGKNGLLMIPCALNLFTQSQIGQLDNCRPPVQGPIPECWPQDGRETKVGSFKDRESKRKRERHLQTDAWSPATHFPQSHCGRIRVIHPKQQHNFGPFPILEFSLESFPAKGWVFQPTPCFQVWSCDYLSASGVSAKRIDVTLGLSCTFFVLSFLFSLANWIQRILRS